MRLFSCIFKQKKCSRMPCTSCMAEYTRSKKEYGCPKCGFGFCQKCLGNKCVIPSLSQLPVPVCLNCYNMLNGKNTAPTKKTRGFNNNGLRGDDGELPPPSLRALYPNQKQPATTAMSVSKKDNEWMDLEARLQRLNEPIHQDEEGTKKQPQPRNGAEMEELEERLAALKGLPVDVIRKPRLLVMNEAVDGEEHDFVLSDEAQQLLRQVEAGVQIGQSPNCSQFVHGTNGSSTSSLHNSSADSLQINKTINEVTTAKSSTSNLSSVPSEQLYPDFSECIKKTIEDAVLAEREAAEFFHRHGQNMDERPGSEQTTETLSTSQQQQQPASGGSGQSSKKFKMPRFFR